jgi:hypothetical protein
LLYEIVPAVRDDAYTASRHTIRGRIVQRDLAKGKEAHVFDEGINLGELEQRVWTQGTYHGEIRHGWERYSYTSPTPIGRRIQQGRPDVLLYIVEIKGKVNPQGVWGYHLVPRSRLAR